MRDKEKRRGFTIVELVIYITIFGILGVFGAQILDVALRSKNTVAKLSEVQTVSQLVFSQITDRVHSSLTIIDASSTLRLEMSSSSINPTVVSVVSGTIVLQEGNATSAITPETVIISKLTFTKITNAAPSTSSVQIQMTAGYNNNGAVDTDTLYSLQTTVMPL